MAVALGRITGRVCGGWVGPGPGTGSEGPQRPASRLIADWLVGVDVYLNSCHLEHHHVQADEKLYLHIIRTRLAVSFKKKEL